MAVPAFSFTVNPVIARVAASSLLMVPIPVASEMVTFGLAAPATNTLLKVAVKVSFSSTFRSPLMVTLKVCVSPCSPTNVKVPEVGS